MKPPRTLFSFADKTPFFSRHLIIGPPAGWEINGEPVEVETDFDLVENAGIHGVPESYLLHYPAPHFTHWQYPTTTTGNTIRLINCAGMLVAFSSVGGPIAGQAFDPEFTNGTEGILNGRTVGWGGGGAQTFGYDQDHLLIINDNDVTLSAEFVFEEGESAVRVAIHVGTAFDLAPPPEGGGGLS